MIGDNAAERAMRPLALGRENDLFMGSLAGGKAAAIAYTLIETAKMNGLDPQAWLTDVLHQIPEHPSNRVIAFCRSFFPRYNTEHRHAGIAILAPMTSTTVEPARSLRIANVPFASPGAGTRSDSSTEPRSPSLFPKRSGSTSRPRPRRRRLLSKSQPPVSQSR